MKHFWEYYLQKHFTFKDIFEAHPDNKTATQGFSAYGKLALKVIRTVPYLCLIAFLFSFYYDFEGVVIQQVKWYDKPISFEGIIRTLAMSGIIGYFTNYVAIKMLFHPREKRPIWGHGLIPSQKYKIAQRIAEAIHEFVVNESIIKKKLKESQISQKITERLTNGTQQLLNDKEFLKELSKYAENTLEQYLQQPEVKTKIISNLDQKLKENFSKGFSKILLKSYTAINSTEYQAKLNKTVDEIPAAVAALIENPEPYIIDIFKQLTEQQANIATKIDTLLIAVLDNLKIQDWLKKQLMEFDEARLELMIEQATSEQLQYIQYLGGVLGILGGLILWQPVLMTIGIGFLVGILLIIDFWLYRKAVK